MASVAGPPGWTSALVHLAGDVSVRFSLPILPLLV